MEKENFTQKKLKNRLKQYSHSAKAMKQQVKAGAVLTLPLGAAFFAANPMVEGAVQYFPNQNIALNVGVGGGNAFIDIDGGGNDLHFFIQNSAFFVRDIGNVESLQGNYIGGYLFAANHTSNVNINAGLGGFAGSTAYATFTSSGSGNFGGMNQGDQGIFAFKLTGDRYGWMRLEKGANANWIAVDWAYEDVANATITPSASLPVEIISFLATTKENKVRLDWLTASEINNAGFEVQRSIDATNYETLDFVEGKGNTFEQQKYFFDDKNLRQGQLYYYRLKQIDFDGEFEYSKVITAQLKGNDISGTFSPNPSGDGNTRLSYNAGQEGQLTLRVFDVAGKALMTQTHEVLEGKNQLDLNFSNLGNGTFFVKMEQDSYSSYQKLIMNFK